MGPPVQRQERSNYILPATPPIMGVTWARTNSLAGRFLLTQTHIHKLLGTDGIESIVANNLSYRCARIRFCGNVLTKPLPRNGKRNHVTILW
jgi:hypothetical protein